MVLVDSNVILDVAIMYSEIAFACATIESVEELLPPHLFDYRAMPREAAFLAARAHADDRSRGGERRSILPDFLSSAATGRRSRGWI